MIHHEAMEPVRITKLLASRGLCSRREAETFMARGWVYVNGLPVTEAGTRAAPDASITLDKQAEALLARSLTVLLHKPIGIVSGQPEKGYRAALSLITAENQFKAGRNSSTPNLRNLAGLAPAGRLDIDSHGLLVLTQDGRIARQLIGQDSKIDKEYLVRFKGNLSKENLVLLNHGLSLDGRRLKPAQVTLETSNQLKFILREGRKRQIRRMCTLVGIEVVGLKRVRIGRVMLGSLPYGKWRLLGPGESF